ncbi:MAG: NAD/NADP octopine/nopaline dehydrogenase family protein [Bacteroidales bacterium]|nr:NAD/NADP octopine/nopaline dehydrogenase family protein [Bacteroidales bacterium]
MENSIKVAVIGAGNNGLTMAAHLRLNGLDVKVWNRSESTIHKLLKTGKIHVSGKINDIASGIYFTNSMKEAIEDVDFIFITQPAHTHKEVAEKMAEFLHKKTKIVLSPGRTFGVFEFRKTLQEAGLKDLPEIVETQTIIYTCRKTDEDKVVLLDFKKSVKLSGFHPEKNEEFIAGLPDCIRNFFIPANSIIETSIGNVGMILHCAPVLLNTGWIENLHTKFLYYYSGITPSIASFLEKLDKERLDVAEKLGVNLPSTKQWLEESYGVKSDNLYNALQAVDSYKTIDAPQTLTHRYIYEDVCTGLVPLEAIGKQLGFEMKITALVIDLSNALLNEDFRKTGRIVYLEDFNK